MNTTSPQVFTEIGLIVISSLAIVGAVVLLFTGKIDYAGCAGLLGGVFALWGANTLYKAPSPSQQAQLGVQQDTLQQIASQALAMLPVFANLLHSHTAPPQPAQAPNALTPTGTPPVQSVPTAANPGTTGTPIQSALSPTGTITTMTISQPVQQPAQAPRDIWSESGLMQAIKMPPQQ
jgi:hypothetical protein